MIFIVAIVIKSAFAAFITGKVETLGSTFRHETAGLLPSSCYYVKSIKNYITNDRQSQLLFYLDLQNIMHNDFSHQQMEICHHIIILHCLLSIVL